MAGGELSLREKENEEKVKGLEGIGLNLSLNRHGNLKSASSDQSLTEIIQNIRFSKAPVSNIFA